MGVKDKKGVIATSQDDNKLEPDDFLKSEKDDKQNQETKETEKIVDKESKNNSEEKVSTPEKTKSKKPVNVIRLEKKDVLFLSCASSGISFSSIGIYSEKEKREIPIYLKLKDGRYSFDKKDLPESITKSFFMKLLGKKGFKPVFDKVAYKEQNKEERKISNTDKAFKLMHPDYSQMSENYNGEYKISVSGKSEIINLHNGITVVEGELIRDILISQGFELIGQ